MKNQIEEMLKNPQSGDSMKLVGILKESKIEENRITRFTVFFTLNWVLSAPEITLGEYLNSFSVYLGEKPQSPLWRWIQGEE